MKHFITDTHAHLQMSPLNKDIDGVISRALDSGVERIIVIGTHYADSMQAVELVNKYKGIYAAVGVHPHDAKDFQLKDFVKFEELLKNEKTIAVGEVGLDYYRNELPAEKQKEVFAMMADLSITFNKPLVIHSREAAEDTVEMLENLTTDGHKILLHCFSGDEALINWGLQRKNVCFSFAGNLTFKKAVNLHSALDKISLDRLFVETDCPYLAPVPKRGKTNEPSYVMHTAQFMADSKGIKFNDLLYKLEQNFINFFGELDIIS